MMRTIEHFTDSTAGARRLGAGGSRPQVLQLGLALACAALSWGCGNQEQARNLRPEQVGLTPDVTPVFDDGETQLFEVKRGMQFPIVQPTGEQEASLASQLVEPYGRMPWVTNKDSKVQLTWTLSNLDDKEHVVELLI